MRRVVIVAMLFVPVLSGCGRSSAAEDTYCASDTPQSADCRSVPTDAVNAEFCKAGAAFSESKGFSNGRKAAEALAKVGTPKDIPPSARTGFLELVERMADAQDGPDFRSRTRTLGQEESAHLLDLDTYIQATC